MRVIAKEGKGLIMDAKMNEKIANEKKIIKLVIFDMDGLMIDTEPISKEYWKQALEFRGLDFREDVFLQMIGLGVDNCAALMRKHYGEDFDFEASHAKRAIYMKEYIETHGVPIKKGLIYMLNRLDELGLKKCIATSTERSSMEKKLTHAGILHRFDGSVTGDEVQEGKPNPEIFLKAAKQIGILPEHCIVLEDSINGIAGAYAAGMHPIMVPDLVPPNAETLARIYAKCNDLEEAAELIATMVQN